MRKLLIKFPSQIRISGWDFGSSARAMNQAGGKDGLMTYESVSKTQADLEKVSKSTTERKSMSTKTSIKRIALVAVTALGFGMLSVVPSSGASAANDDYISLTDVVLDTATTTYGARVNNEISIAVTGYTAGIAAPAGTDDITYLSVAAAVTSSPSGSTAQPYLYSVGDALGTRLDKVGADLVYEDDQAVATTVNSQATSSAPATLNYTVDTADEAVTEITNASNTTLSTLKFTPTHVGTYKITVWNEKRDSAIPTTANNGDDMSATAVASLSGSESYQVFTIIVSSGVASITLTPHNAVSAAGGTQGSLVKVTIKDAAGNVAALAAGETISIDPSGTGDVAAVNGSLSGGTFSNTVSSDAGAAYSLTNADFTSGVAWLNIIDATAEIVNLVASYSGDSSVTSNTTVEFKTINAAETTVATVAIAATQTTGYAGSTDAWKVPIGAFSVTFEITDNDAAADDDFTSTEYKSLTIQDTAGKVTGVAGASFDVAVVNAGTYTVSGTSTSAAEQFRIQDDTLSASDATPDDVFTAEAISFTGIDKTTVDVPSSVRVAPAGTFSTVVTVKDQFGRAYANGRVVLSMSGRNTLASVSGTTNSSGKATLSYTDAAASTVTATVDTVTITSYDEAGVTDTATISVNWVATTVGSVTLDYPGVDDTIAGTTSTDISAAAAGATGSSATVTATVKDANGTIIVGTPVTFTVSGLVGAEVHTTKVTVYTDSIGEAATSISSYAAGTATVKAVAGAKDASASIYFKQKTATEARTIAATSANGGVMATVTDRYGNAIEGVTVNATRASGTGFFANGSSSTSGTTDKNGQVEFKFEGAGSVKVAFTAEDYGQSADASGKVSTTAVTAAAAGTTTTNQTGLGASLAPAGVNSVTVEVAATTGATDAVDAANEATDAANAATDAANAAAEAADAATAAAQDAQAAVAALATEVAAMISGIKAQIIRLTNLVVKIQKKVNA